MDKQFIVRKYVMAKNIGEAIRKEKSCPVDDAWIDDEWKKKQETSQQLPSAIGFTIYHNDD